MSNDVKISEPTVAIHPHFKKLRDDKIELQNEILDLTDRLECMITKYAALEDQIARKNVSKDGKTRIVML